MADAEKPSDEVDAVAARSETDKEPAADPSANNAATADPTTNSSANTSTVSLPKLVPIAADSYVKLFVGQLPGVCDSDELKTAFLAHGPVLELAVLRDKRTGKPQGCAFVKYQTRTEAEAAIRALNNVFMLTGATQPIQVRFADGELERLGATEHKLFVGGLAKSATSEQIAALFEKFGRVQDVYIMRGDSNEPKGCAFVKFLSKDEALAAIAGLNEKFIMEVTRPLRAPHTRLHPRSHRLVPHAAGSKHRLQKRRRPLSQTAHS